LQVNRKDICAFDEVPDEFALAEREGDLFAEDFRASLITDWARVCEGVDESTQVVQVYFE
jgi:uncharacterized protein YhfF